MVTMKEAGLDIDVVEDGATFRANAVKKSTEILEKSGRRWPLLSFTALAGGLFAAFYPVLSGLPVSRSYCDLFRRGMTSWPI